MLNIEAVKVPKGKVSATGKLGEVMKESLFRLLNSLSSSRAKVMELILADLAKHDVHVHVPEGNNSKRRPLCGCSHGNIDYFSSDRNRHCVAMLR